MFDRTITIYSYRRSEDRYYGTVIRNCTVQTTESSSDFSKGSGGSDRISISIRCDAGKKVITGNGKKQYLTAKAYQAAESISDKFSMTPEADFIVLGERTDLVVVDGEYPNGFYQFLNIASDDVFMISNVSYYSLIPHFTVTGR